MKLEPVDLLFFGAHPDDVELSAGGTIVAAVKRGLGVGMIDLTRGEMGTRGTPTTRKREARNSARILGATFREQLDFGDGALRTTRSEELVLIDVIRQSRPRLVFAPYPDDRHPDHTRTGKLVTEAAFYAGLKQLETEFAAHRPQTTIYYLQNYMLPPSFVVDTSHTWTTKMRS
ncbi:MAG: bacillithiol biosynthesis deacetylase BshB1, partial [Acidobacteriota bacterium]